MKRKGIQLVFDTYILFLIIFVIFKFNGSLNSMRDKIESVQQSRALVAWNYNFVLFRTIKEQLNDIESIWALKNLAANILVFVPFGILFPCYRISKRYYSKK